MSTDPSPRPQASRQPLRERFIALARRRFPRRLRDAIVRLQRLLRLNLPPVGTVRFGSLRRTTPISPVFALDRGQPIERYYIDRFLDAHREDLRGRALEFGDTTYLDRFGDERLTRKDVFSYVPLPGATVVGDLSLDRPPVEGIYDCIVCTQTLQMIFDVQRAVHNLCAMLAPGGVLLVTTHGTSKVGRYVERDGWGEYWHMTRAAADQLFAKEFDGEHSVAGYGNVLSAIGALHGLAANELTRAELDYPDRDFDVIVGVRAVRRMPVT